MLFASLMGRGSFVPALSVNVKVGTPTPRVLITGMHTVADISCANCNTLVGWCYVRALRMLHHQPLLTAALQIAADDDSQKYKEGKYVLEKTRIIKENGWTA